MRAVDVIARKRDGHALSRDEIQAFVRAVTDGVWPEYQVSALLMAIVLRGMTAEETADLTEAMVHSGVKVDLSDLPGLKIDKHSTGGVGDKTSLILAPLAAACGVVVPMMSGRGPSATPAARSTSSNRFPASASDCCSASSADAGGGRLQHDRPDRRNRPGRQEALRPARRDRRRSRASRSSPRRS